METDNKIDIQNKCLAENKLACEAMVQAWGLDAPGGEIERMRKSGEINEKQEQLLRKTLKEIESELTAYNVLCLQISNGYSLARCFTDDNKRANYLKKLVAMAKQDHSEDEAEAVAGEEQT